MSGIAGIAFSDAFQITHIIAPMLKTQKHRGSDSLEEITYKYFQIGITGRKFSKFEQIILGLDGLILYQEKLVAELQNAGRQLTGQENQSDLIIHAYLAWGVNFLEKIQGNFALFILDKTKDELILARDRMGKKPLYWYQDQNHFLFASEMKALLASGVVPQAPALDAISTYLYLGYTPQDISAIKKVNKLLPGHYLQMTRERQIAVKPYWQLDTFFTHSKAEPKNIVISKVDTMLRESLTSMLPKDGSFGCFLLGGLGSAAVAYYLKQVVPSENITAFSVAFQDENLEDIFAAEEVARSLNIDYQYEIIRPDMLLNDIPKIVWYLGEPQANPNVVAIWHLAKIARAKKVIFSGMGSDELLAGHARYTLEEREVGYLNWLLQYSMPLLKIILLPLMKFFYKKGAYSLLQQSRVRPWQLDYLNQNALFYDRLRAKAAPKIAHLFDPYIFLNKFQHLSNISSPLSSFLYLDMKTRLVDCFILEFERLTTANGLEWRTPFLSKELIEYLAGLFEASILEESETFFVLKALLKNQLPVSFLHRPKRSRPDFLKTWVQKAKIDKVFNVLPSGVLVEMGILSPVWLKEATSTPERSKNNFPYLWAALMLEVWYRLFITNPVPTSAPDVSLEEFLRIK